MGKFRDTQTHTHRYIYIYIQGVGLACHGIHFRDILKGVRMLFILAAGNIMDFWACTGTFDGVKLQGRLWI